jgi:8-oxo-dGTP pyrophosphatase MutT (NUDIX family)
MGQPGSRREAAGRATADGAKRRRRRKRPSADHAAVEGTPPVATPAAPAGSTTGAGARSRGKKKKSKAKAARTKRRARTSASVPTKREISAGGVMYRRDGDQIEVVLASRRTRRGQLAWGLAKGGIEEDESMEAAAVREVREETGLVGEIEESLGETRYFYVWENVRIRKTVHFFLMRHTGGDIEDRDDEMEEIRWFPLERALKRAAYRGERDVLGRAAELLR